MGRKIFILTLVNLEKIGYRVENVWLFNTREDAHREMESQYNEALEQGEWNHLGKVIDKWYAYIPMVMYWNIFEKSLSMGDDREETKSEESKPGCQMDKVTTYVGRNAEETGLVMYHSVEDYLNGEVCYIPSVQFNLYSDDSETPILHASTVKNCRLGETKESITNKVRNHMRACHPDFAAANMESPVFETVAYEAFVRLDGETVEQFLTSAPVDTIADIVSAHIKINSHGESCGPSSGQNGTFFAV